MSGCISTKKRRSFEKNVIIESVVGAILNFHGKVVRFVPEHTWALTVSVAGLLWLWLMEKVKR